MKIYIEELKLCWDKITFERLFNQNKLISESNFEKIIETIDWDMISVITSELVWGDVGNRWGNVKMKIMSYLHTIKNQVIR